MYIYTFDVFRSSDGGISENQKSTTVYAKIKLGMTNPSDIANASLYYGESTTGFDSYAISNANNINTKFGLNSAADLNVEKTILIGTGYSITTDYYFKLVFRSSYGRDEKLDVVMRAAVPLFIHKNNYGVSVGQYSGASAGDPRFESNWPAYFYGGVADLGGDWVELQTESGVTSGGEYGGGPLVARKVEGKCIIQGSVEATPGSSTIKLAKLPDPIADWSPGSEQSAVFSINACKGNRIARIAVPSLAEDNKGYLCLSWVWDMNEGKVLTGTKIWIQCSIEYWPGAWDGIV